MQNSLAVPEVITHILVGTGHRTGFNPKHEAELSVFQFSARLSLFPQLSDMMRTCLGQGTEGLRDSGLVIPTANSACTNCPSTDHRCQGNQWNEQVVRESQPSKCEMENYWLSVWRVMLTQGPLWLCRLWMGRRQIII